MKITADMQAQRCRYDGRWHELSRALEVDCDAGIAQVAGPSGQPMEVIGVFRVLDANTGEVLAQTVQPHEVPAATKPEAAEADPLDIIEHLP